MKIAAVLLAVLLGAGPALALSCLQPDAVRLYEAARDSESDYWIAVGRIRAMEEVNVPESGLRPPQDEESHADTKVQFLGRVLVGDRIFHPFARRVTLRLTCVSAWCAGDPGDAQVIAAIEVAERGLVLSIGPCSETAVPHTEDGMERLLACHADGECVHALP